MQKRGKRLAGYVPDYVVFDLETTGLSPVSDRIIEISGLRVRAGQVEETFSTLVNPERKIPRGATAVNGITAAMVAGAPCVRDADGEFLGFAGGNVLVGHNIHSFDMKFLYRAAEEIPSSCLDNDYIDTLLMARKYMPELAHHRLVDLAQYFGFSTQGAHRALADCMMNQKCFEELGKRQTEREKAEKERRKKEGMEWKEASAGMQGDAGESGQMLCPRCQSPLVLRTGRFGRFLGCSNFPACRYTRNL